MCVQFDPLTMNLHLQIIYLKNNTDQIATSVNDMQAENRRRQNLARVSMEMQENVFQQVDYIHRNVCPS